MQIPLCRLGKRHNSGKPAVAVPEVRQGETGQSTAICGGHRHENYMIATNRRGDHGRQETDDRFQHERDARRGRPVQGGRLQNAAPAATQSMAQTTARSRSTGQTSRIDSMITAVGPTPRIPADRTAHHRDSPTWSSHPRGGWAGIRRPDHVHRTGARGLGPAARAGRRQDHGTTANANAGLSSRRPRPAPTTTRQPGAEEPEAIA